MNGPFAQDSFGNQLFLHGDWGHSRWCRQSSGRSAMVISIPGHPDTRASCILLWFLFGRRAKGHHDMRTCPSGSRS